MERSLEALRSSGSTVLESKDAELVSLITTEEDAIQVEGVLSSENALDVDELADQSYSGSFWQIFTSTFITIFLAEIGDKTQISTLLMSAEFHKPWVVFAGAGTALVATSFLGVWIGQWLATRLSPRTLNVAAGIMLALISVSLLWDVVRM